MKNKKTVWIIVIVIVVLAAAVAVFALLNAGNVKEKQESQDNATVTVIMGDQEETFDLAYLKSYEKTEFNAIQDTSDTDAVEKSFGGVPLITVLNDLGFDISGSEQVVFAAADGYTSVVTTEVAMDSENVYLVYERDGEPSGTKQEGGSGPIEIIIAKDEFAQRWCKFLMEIEIE